MATSRSNLAECAAPPARRPRAAFAPGDSTGPTAAAQSNRVLIVEDDFLVAMQVEAALIEAGFEVAGIATSAESAVELATTQRPALAIMDIRLAGGRDGIDVAVQLFQDHRIQCIFATAHRDPEAQRRAQPAAPLGWLQKPYSMETLVAMVRRALSGPERDH